MSMWYSFTFWILVVWNKHVCSLKLLTTKLNYRLPSSEARRRCHGIESRHSIWDSGNFHMSYRSRVCYGYKQDHNRMSTWRKLEYFLHPTLSGGLLRSCATDWQWLLNRLQQRHLSGRGSLPVLRRLCLPFRASHREGVLLGWRPLGTTSYLSW